MMVVDIARNFREVAERVRHAAERAGRDPDDLIIIGAAKTVEPDRIYEAVAAGLRHVGENYVQEGVAKMAALPPTVTWHFIGYLQTNKVKQVVSRFHYLHSLDRLALLEELEKRAAASAPIPALVEVNLAKEATKSGAAPAEVDDLVQRAAACAHLRLVGLMTMPPLQPPAVARAHFRRLRELRDELQMRRGVALPHLSMGMTNDYEVAIEEGATMVRIGTGIFGPRTRSAQNKAGP